MSNKNLFGTSNDKVTPGVGGENTGTGPAIHGESIEGRGVEGKSTNNYGVRAHSDGIAGLRASSTKSRGLEGWGVLDDGVWGISTNANGVHGIGENNGAGVAGESNTGTGVVGTSQHGDGVSGFGHRGVVGESIGFQGVHGKSRDNAGVVGESDNFDGVFGVSHNPTRPGISAHNRDQNGNPNKGGLAGFFDGDVIVTGDIRLTNADFAEDFDVIEVADPGEVMVLTASGTLKPSTIAYDKKVVGVLSGAGNYKPGIILDKQNNNANRKPIAMMGKVYCKVDADTFPIETGDMLTTSNTPGYAMKAIDPFKAFGAVIGKALASLNQGKGLIPILVVLQ